MVACRLRLVGLSTVVAGIVQSNRSDASLKEMLTGGDHYCFYRAEFVNPKNLSVKVPLWVICDGPLYNLSVWFSPADASDANDPRYWSIGGQHFNEIIPGGFRSGMALGIGKYRIEMSARNGTVTEMLEIKEIDNAFTQSLAVFSFPRRKNIFRVISTSARFAAAGLARASLASGATCDSGQHYRTHQRSFMADSDMDRMWGHQTLCP